LHINASRDNGVDFIKSKVEGFVQTMPFGDFKIVLMDEADYLSQNAQAILRGLMETYASQARFILTCNYPHKIMPALHSRTQGFHIDKTDHTEFTARVATILVTEGIEFELDTLDSYVKATYPDLRKCLNLVQPNSSTGVLTTPGDSDTSAKDWRLDAVELFKQGKIRPARELICSQASTEDINDVFRWMYDNLSIWSDTPEGQDKAIITIRKGLATHAVVADAEINLSATLVELTLIG
jgi:replication factor C small subunit